MAKRSLEPVLWLLFSAGGVASALLVPILVLLFGLAFPLGWLSAPNYEHVHGLLRHPVTRVALFGTRFTMEARFYPDVFAAAGIALMVPSADEREYIHGCYMDELIHGRFLPQTRESMTAIADRMVERHAVQALVLGGTELPLLFRDGPPPRMPLLDTMRIHAERAVSVMLAD